MDILNMRLATAKVIMLFFSSIFICNILMAQVYKTDRKEKHYKTLSPDKQTIFELKNVNGNLFYRVSFSQRQIVEWSSLGLDYNHIIAGQHTNITKHFFSSERRIFAWPLGEDDSVANNYNEEVFNCISDGLPFNIIVRVFDGSIAFRYQISQQQQVGDNKIHKELTTFVFNKSLQVYQYNQESVFTPTNIDSLKNTCDFPATITDNKNIYVSVGEADNENYTKAELAKGIASHSLQVSFLHDTIVHAAVNFETPWRTISYSAKAIGLHDYSKLYLKLVKPATDSVPKWIVPGKLIRSQLTTADGVRCVDFAAKNDFQYVMFDAGWYGKEFRTSSDPTTYIEELNIPQVIQYGKSKNIGIILYVNYVGLKMHLDEIIPLYKKWGVAGIKFGFVDGLSQNGITWLMHAVKSFTDAGFIVDVHDNYKPTGMSRKFPGWLTQEGIRGDENAPDAFHTTVLPFTRFLAGPADFTFCYPNAQNDFSKNLKVSMAQQLALTVIYFSPLQSIFWYGRPENYTDEKQIEFFRYVPTVWNESHYLTGEIGKYISVARRKGNVWFMGNAAGMQDWKDTIKLNFLNPNTTYKAVLYEDGTTGGIVKRTIEVKRGDSFPIHIKAKGGQSVIITPSENK